MSSEPKLNRSTALKVIAQQEGELLQLEDERDYYRNLLCKCMKIIKGRYFMLAPDGEEKWENFVNNDMDGFDGTLEP